MVLADGVPLFVTIVGLSFGLFLLPTGLLLLPIQHLFVYLFLGDSCFCFPLSHVLCVRFCVWFFEQLFEFFNFFSN